MHLLPKETGTERSENIPVFPAFHAGVSREKQSLGIKVTKRTVKYRAKILNFLLHHSNSLVFILKSAQAGCLRINAKAESWI